MGRSRNPTSRPRSVPARVRQPAPLPRRSVADGGLWYPESRYSRGSILVDGVVTAGWHVVRAKGTATMLVDLFTDLAPSDRAAVEAEGAELLSFIAAEADARDVVLARYEAPR